MMFVSLKGLLFEAKRYNWCHVAPYQKLLRYWMSIKIIYVTLYVKIWLHVCHYHLCMSNYIFICTLKKVYKISLQAVKIIENITLTSCPICTIIIVWKWYWVVISLNWLFYWWIISLWCYLFSSRFRYQINLIFAMIL